MSKSIRSTITQLVIVFVLAFGGLGIWKYGNQLPLIGTYFGGADTQASAKRDRPPTPVDVAIARTGHVTVILEAIGTALANEAVTITSEVSGIIENIHFKEGETVEKGSVLVNLESGVQLAEVEKGVAEGAEDTAKTEEGKDKATKPTDEKTKAASGDKGKTAKPADNKVKTAAGDKGKTSSKETKKK